MTQSRNPGTSRKFYVCIGHLDKDVLDRLPPAELQATMANCWPHIVNMYASKQVILEAGLTSQAWWIQRMNDAVRTIDGPFAEAKEIVGSVVLIEADSDAEALRIARLHPTTQVPDGERLGWRMEVRPVHYFHAPALGAQGQAAGEA